MRWLESLRSFGRWLAIGALVTGAAVLGACGGGGGGQFASGGIVGTGDASVISVGTISAFGAGTITVNGVTFATGTATVRVNGLDATVAALGIGMVVTVQGGARQADGSVVANTIDYRPEIQGVVGGVDSAALAFTVLGQRVRTDRLTVFDGGTFATLLNQYVEVSGFRSSPGEMLATRVAIRPSVTVGAPLEVTGTVTLLDPAAKTFYLGTQLVDYAQTPAAFVPAGLANGAVAKAKGTVIGAGDRLIATGIELVASVLSAPESAQVEIEGLITAYAGLASFRVNGQAVDGRGATFEGGTAALLADGVKVEVEGRLTQGIVVATKIEIEQDAATVVIDGLADAVDVTGGSVSVSGQRVMTTSGTQYEDHSAAAVRDFGLAAIAVGDRLSISANNSGTGLVAKRIERLDRSAPADDSAPDASAEGLISEFVSVAEFKVGAQTVNASSATFVGGTAANLANGQRVEVEGVLSGAVLLATRVTFKAGDDSTTPGSIEVEGAISSFVSVSSFVVAGQKVDASSASFSGGNAANLANGVRVNVKGAVTGGVLVASSLAIDSSTTTTTIEVEGLISGFVSVANFTVSGQKIDASKATIKNGTAADLANGRKCKVKGPVVGGLLQATTVELEDAPELQDAKVEGTITGFVSVSNFKVAGRTVDASSAGFSHGTAADLANGKQVKIEGTLVGTVLKASKVEFDD